MGKDVEKPSASPLDKFKWRFEITAKTLLDVSGLRKEKGTFDGIPA
jgi:hypothetical protein